MFQETFDFLDLDATRFTNEVRKWFDESFAGQWVGRGGAVI